MISKLYECDLEITKDNYEGYLELYKLYRTVKNEFSIPIGSVDDIKLLLNVFSNYDASKLTSINVFFDDNYKEKLEKKYQYLCLLLLRMKILKWRYSYINLDVNFGQLENELINVHLLKYNRIDGYKIDFHGFEENLEIKEKIDCVKLFDMCKYKPLSRYNKINGSYVKRNKVR